MNLKKRLPALVLSLALLASLTTVYAAPGEDVGGNVPDEGERKNNGHTTISIMEATVNPGNISFEVPLYITMAVIKDAAKVETPSNYAIKNTSQAGAKFPMGVTSMNFAKLANSTYKTVAAAPATAEDEIFLKIGGAPMPTLAVEGNVNVPLKDSVMMDGDKIKVIPAATSETDTANKLDLPVEGTVVSADRANKGAVAQFKIVYTVSALDLDGKPLGSVYAGDDSFKAGLGDQSSVVAP